MSRKRKDIEVDAKEAKSTQPSRKKVSPAAPEEKGNSSDHPISDSSNSSSSGSSGSGGSGKQDGVIPFDDFVPDRHDSKNHEAVPGKNGRKVIPRGAKGGNRTIPPRNSSGRSTARRYKVLRKEDGSLQFKQLKPGVTLYFKGFSQDGLQLGKEKEDGRAGSLYMRFTSLSQPDSDEDTVKTFLTEVDSTMMSLFEECQSDIYDNLQIDQKVFPTIILRNGWQEKANEMFNKETTVEKVFYPHPKWTKLAKIKNGNIIPTKATLHSQVDRLANSDWTLQIGITAFSVEYQEKAKRLTLQPFYGIQRIVYIDDGQSLILDQDRRQELEEEREKRDYDNLLSFAGDLINVVSSKKK